MRIVLPLRFYHSVLFRITQFCFLVILDSYWSMRISRSLFNPVSTISSGHSSLLIPFDISSNFFSQFTNHIQSQNNCFSFSLLDRVLLSSSYSYACSVSYSPYVFNSRFHFQFQFFLFFNFNVAVDWRDKDLVLLNTLPLFLDINLDS